MQTTPASIKIVAKTTKCRWSSLLSREEIAASHALTAKLDPRFARAEREFYESQSAAQLGALAAQAWNCNESCRYQLARSYGALAEQVA